MVVLSGMAASWKPATGGLPQGSTPRPKPFNIFHNDLDDATECTLRQYVYDTKPVAGGTPDGCATSTCCRNGPTGSYKVLQWEMQVLQLRGITPCTSRGWGPSAGT